MLSWRDFNAARRLCREWLAAAQKPHRRSEEIDHISPAQLHDICQMQAQHAASRCVTALDMRDGYGLTCRLEHVKLLRQLPYLTAANLRLNGFELEPFEPSGAMALAQLFPPTLRILHVELENSSYDAVDTVLVHALSHLPRLSHLQLANIDGAADLSSLAQLRELRYLQLHVDQSTVTWGSPVDDRLCFRSLATLASLTHLHLENGWTVEMLTALAQWQLPQLQRIDPLEQPTSAHMVALAQLPALTQLSARITHMAHDSLPLLHGFRTLKKLSLIVSGCSETALAEASCVTRPLVACGSTLCLESVTLHYLSFTEGHLQELVLAVPDLRELELTCCSVGSLAALSSLSHLHTLFLWPLKFFEPAHLQPLQGSASLRKLLIHLPNDCVLTLNRGRRDEALSLLFNFVRAKLTHFDITFA